MNDIITAYLNTWNSTAGEREQLIAAHFAPGITYTDPMAEVSGHAEISALIQERCFTSLEAPIARITGWDTPFPYTLENEYLPLAPRILGALRGLKAYEA